MPETTSAFDLNVYIKKYTDEYDKLPTKEYKLMGLPTERVSTPEEVEMNLGDTINDNMNNTACVTCPYHKKCNRLDWTKDHTWLKVTGCSQHPDQEKFRGHSTTVTITDSTVSATHQENVFDGNWDSARNAAASNAGIFTAQVTTYIYKQISNGLRTICRANLYFDTSAIPIHAAISAANHNFYVYNIINNLDNAATYDLVKGITAPHSPVVAADYDRTKYDIISYGNIAHASLSLNAYNAVPITNFPYVVKGGATLGEWIISADLNNEFSTVANTTVYGIQARGSSAANPPQLVVTYDMVTTPIICRGY